MNDVLQAINDNAPAFTGISALLVAITGYATYLLTKARNKQDKDEGRSGLVADALALQEAAQTAYENAREEATLARAEFAELRAEIQAIRDEMTHWRTVAEAGRDAAVAAGDPYPFWFKPFVTKEA